MELNSELSNLHLTTTMTLELIENLLMDRKPAEETQKPAIQNLERKKSLQVPVVQPRKITERRSLDVKRIDIIGSNLTPQHRRHTLQGNTFF